jgi:hypothetical protein
MNANEPRGRRLFRISRTLIVNTLCCVNGALLAANIAIVWPHWHAIVSLVEDIARCVTEAPLR